MAFAPTLNYTDLTSATLVQLGCEGAIYRLGDLPDQFGSGGFGLSFAPDDAWNGSFAILGMGVNKSEYDDNIQPVSWPFRAFYLNGVSMDPTILQVPSPDPSAPYPITGRSEILVPASGKQIFLQVGALPILGTCAVYVRSVCGTTQL